MGQVKKTRSKNGEMSYGSNHTTLAGLVLKIGFPEGKILRWRHRCWHGLKVIFKVNSKLSVGLKLVTRDDTAVLREVSVEQRTEITLWLAPIKFLLLHGRPIPTFRCGRTCPRVAEKFWKTTGGTEWRWPSKSTVSFAPRLDRICPGKPPSRPSEQVFYCFCWKPWGFQLERFPKISIAFWVTLYNSSLVHSLKKKTEFATIFGQNFFWLPW